MLGDRNIAHRFPVDPLYIVGAKQVHGFFIACQVESNIRDYHPQRQGLNPDFLVRIFPLGVQEFHNVGVVSVEINCARTLPRPQLVGVREGILEQFHYRNYPGGLILDFLNRGTRFPQVSKREGDPASAFRKL